MDELQILRARVAELEGHLKARGLVEAPCKRTGVCRRCGTTNHDVIKVPLRAGESVRTSADGTCGVTGCGGFVPLVGETSVPG